MRAKAMTVLLWRDTPSGSMCRILRVGVLSSPENRYALTATAQALLGLLALRPVWSTWSLTTQLRRNMRFFWPCAESRIFAEALRLEARALATTAISFVGRRARTTYSITA